MKAFQLVALIFTVQATAAVSASPIRYEFSVSSLTGGGVLSGSFLAEDINSDGGIAADQGEVFDFEYSIVGDSIIEDLHLTQTDFESNTNNVFSIWFSLDNNLIIDGLYDNSPIFKPDPFPYPDAFLLVHYVEDETGTIPLIETVFVAGPAGIGGSVCDGTALCTSIQQSFINPDGSPGGVIASSTTSILTLTTVPVPSTAWLFLSALVGMASFKHQTRYAESS